MILTLPHLYDSSGLKTLILYPNLFLQRPYCPHNFVVDTLVSCFTKVITEYEIRVCIRDEHRRTKNSNTKNSHMCSNIFPINHQNLYSPPSRKSTSDTIHFSFLHFRQVPISPSKPLLHIDIHSLVKVIYLQSVHWAYRWYVCQLHGLPLLML